MLILPPVAVPVRFGQNVTGSVFFWESRRRVALASTRRIFESLN
jgi:hypothetical protein